MMGMTHWLVLIGSIGFLLLFLSLVVILSTILPVWSIVDCAVSENHSKGKKTLWILLSLFTWSLGSLIYGLWGTPSRILKRFTLFCVGGLGLVGLIFGGVFLLNPTVVKQGMFSGVLNKIKGKSGVSVLGEKPTYGEDLKGRQSKSADMLKFEANMKILNNDPQGAVDILTAVLNADPNDMEALIFRGSAKLKIGNEPGGMEDLQSGLSRIEDAMKKTPPNGKLYYLKSLAYRSLKQFDLAIENLKTAIQLSPDKTTYPLELKMLEIQKSMPKPPPKTDSAHQSR